MSKPNSPPQQWAEIAHAWTPEFFMMQVYQCYSVEHLRAAVEYEANNKCRTKRIQKLNKRIHQVK